MDIPRLFHSPGRANAVPVEWRIFTRPRERITVPKVEYAYSTATPENPGIRYWKAVAP